MASRKRSRGKKRSGARIAAAALFACALLFVLFLYMQSRVLTVRYATVYAKDLPRAFDGTTILFATDIDAKGLSDARAAAALFRNLRSLKPDLLLLGGDYAGLTLYQSINGADPADKAVAARMADARDAFLRSLADFPAPLGKYAVAAADDIPEGLDASMDAGGVRLLADEIVFIHRDGARMALVGLSPAGGSAPTEGILAADFAVALTGSPAQFVRALTAEASDGGAWADLLLAGGTHGGQMRIADRTLLDLTEHEMWYLSGWRKEGNAFLLTSEGVGCEFANLRFNTTPEVHLITLRCAEGD